MAQFTIYKSTDGSAPVLSGTVGSLVALLDACLVTGYGAKVAAGWTKPFTGANKAAFQQGIGSNQMYLRVQDDAPGAGGAREARIVGYETMSDVDTGTNPFPTVAQFTNGMFARKSTSLNATARPWVVVADARTVYWFNQPGDTTTTDLLTDSYVGCGFGEFYSFQINDAYRVFIIGRPTEGVGANLIGGGLGLRSANVTLADIGHYIARGHTGTAGAVQVGIHGDSVKGDQTNLDSAGIVPYTNPSDGGLYLAQQWIHDPTTAPTPSLRGRMRGLWWFLQPLASVNDGDTASGGASGELTGKTFLFLKRIHGASNVGSNAGLLAIETSNTLETN
jgi:hypothetical protein